MLVHREHRLFIGGEWRPGGAGTMPATSPSSGQEFAVLAVADPADVDDAAAAAAAAWPEWARASAFDRAAWSERVAAGIRGRRDQLARALTEDQGKPLLAEPYDDGGLPRSRAYPLTSP